MANNLGDMVVKIVGDNKEFDKSVDKSEQKFGALSSAIAAGTLSMAKALKRVDNQAEVFGKSVTTLKDKQQILRTEMERLIQDGVDPADKSIKDLKNQYDNLGIKIKASTVQVNKSKVSLKQIGDVAEKVGKKLTTFVTLPILAAGAASVKLASDYGVSLNKVDVAFGESQDKVLEWSETTADSIGVASGAALDAVSVIGDMATSMGLASDQAADMGIQLVDRAGDLASFKNISIDIANTALKGVFTGETESLKALGVVMT